MAKRATPNPPKQPPSRHARFVAIMEAAAGKASADYCGYGRFWSLPLPQLRHVTLYGIAMMQGGGAAAPDAPAGKPCCGGGQPAPAAFPGGTPGLILGLRGLAPFDGTQFPPLPWGGTPVAPDDIAFIAGWIADGCPSAETDTQAPRAQDGSGQAAATLIKALASGTAPHPAAAAPINQLAVEAGTLKARKNIAYLTDEELRRLRAAIAQMKTLDPYYQDERSFAYWARIHANQCQHGWEEFLTWHRAYLYGFEKRLQDIDPSVTLPYWDWAADAVNVKVSLEDMGPAAVLDNGYVPPAFQCWIDETGLAALTAGDKVSKPALAGLKTILGTPYCSGSRLFHAAGIKPGVDATSDAAIIAALEAINPLWHWQRWPGGNPSIIFEAYPTPDDVGRILEIESFFTFGSGPMDDQHFGALENVHNLIHNFSGGLNPDNPSEAGDMVDPGRTAFDPIFWMHHTNIDRLWAQWQRSFPGVGPDNPDAILPPWSFTVDDMKSTRALGYEYMMNAHVFPTDSTVPIARFASAATPIHQGVIANHRAAQVRLHAVQYVTRPGFFIRVFLNQPDATIATPTTGNPHYVGQVSMFTGACVGGPGHCAVPVPTTDPFDFRPRPHKTPSSFRLDATAAVRALGGAADALQVNVFAFNLDGSPAGDALKLDAVSLVFFD